MKKITLDEWEKKYIVSPIEQYNQKNEMFERVKWDPEIKEQVMKLGGMLNIIGETRDRPGFTLLDQALRFASWAGSMLDLLNTSMPNPLQASKDVEAAIEASGFSHPFLAYHPPKGARIDTSHPQNITDYLKKVAIFYGADLVGVCKLDRRWLYSHTANTSVVSKPPGHSGGSSTDILPENPKPAEVEYKPQVIPEEFQYAIVLAFEMDYNMIKYYQTFLPLAAVCMGYSRLAFTNMLLSAFIRNLGFQAINCATNHVSLHIPMAMQAGLGDIGRNGLLVTPKFGPRVRLTTVLTDLPLVADSPIDFGVTEFCGVCQKCAEMCPSKSIPYGKRTPEQSCAMTASGGLKWPINSETCFLHWLRGKKDCSICIAVCPYNKFYSWPHRTTLWFTDHLRWADPFYVKMDDLLGYGKPKNMDDFWEKWNPTPYGHAY